VGCTHRHSRNLCLSFHLLVVHGRPDSAGSSSRDGLWFKTHDDRTKEEKKLFCNPYIH